MEFFLGLDIPGTSSSQGPVILDMTNDQMEAMQAVDPTLVNPGNRPTLKRESSALSELKAKRMKKEEQEEEQKSRSKGRQSSSSVTSVIWVNPFSRKKFRSPVVTKKSLEKKKAEKKDVIKVPPTSVTMKRKPEEGESASDPEFLYETHGNININIELLEYEE